MAKQLQGESNYFDDSQPFDSLFVRKEGRYDYNNNSQNTNPFQSLRRGSTMRLDHHHAKEGFR